MDCILRNVAKKTWRSHNAYMGLDYTLIQFLQRIAIGAAVIFGLLLVIRLSTGPQAKSVPDRTSN